MARIEKRGNGYRITVSNGYDKDHQQIRVTKLFVPTKKRADAIEKEVQEAAILFEKEVLSGEYKSGEKMSFSKFYTEWETKHAGRRLSVRTLEDYKKIIDTLYMPEFGNIKITKINAYMIEQILLKEEARGVSPATLKKDIAVLSSMFSKAVKWNFIKENPCLNVDFVPEAHKINHREHTFTANQAKIFIKMLCKGYVVTKRQHERTLKSTGKKYFVPEYSEIHTIPLQFQCMFLILLHDGIRRGECIALTWKDIDFKQRIITINKATTLAHGEQIIKTPKTESGYRQVVTSEMVIDLLKRWKAEQKEIFIRCGDSWQGKCLEDFDDNFIFIQNNGKQMNLSTAGHKFKEIIEYHNASCKKSEKLPLIRLHDLRHTMATLHVSKNTNIKTVSYILGHSNTSITYDWYVEDVKSDIAEASETMDKVLGL